MSTYSVLSQGYRVYEWWDSEVLSHMHGGHFSFASTGFRKSEIIQITRPNAIDLSGNLNSIIIMSSTVLDWLILRPSKTLLLMRRRNKVISLRSVEKAVALGMSASLLSWPHRCCCVPHWGNRPRRDCYHCLPHIRELFSALPAGCIPWLLARRKGRPPGLTSGHSCLALVSQLNERSKSEFFFRLRIRSYQKESIRTSL